MLNDNEMKDLRAAVTSLGYSEDLADALVDARAVSREGGRAGLWVPRGVSKAFAPITGEAVAEFANVNRQFCEAYRGGPRSTAHAAEMSERDAQTLAAYLFG